MNKLGVVVTFGLLAVVIAMMIVVFMPKHCAVARMEGFTASAAIGTTTCPRGTRAYTDKQGNLNCCAGEVSGNFCEGTITCTFSSGMGDSVPICRSPGKQLVTEFKPDFCVQGSGKQLQQLSIAKCEFNNEAQVIEMTSQNSLVSKKSGMCLDILGNNTSTGTAIVEYPCHNGINQKWHIDGKRIVSFMNGNKCITVDKNNKLIIADCVGAEKNQRWSLMK